MLLCWVLKKGMIKCLLLGRMLVVKIFRFDLVIKLIFSVVVKILVVVVVIWILVYEFGLFVIIIWFKFVGV